MLMMAQNAATVGAEGLGCFRERTDIFMSIVSGTIDRLCGV